MRLCPPSINANAKRLLIAKALRSIADGYVSILLPAYLLELRLSAFQVGALTTATLLGSAALTILTGLITARFGYRRPFIAASALMVATGLAFSSLEAFWPLMLVAFIGTLNPSSGDVSIVLPLDHSLLSQSVADQDRTTLFAHYSLAGSLLGAVGTLLAGVPQLAVGGFGATPLHAMQAMFWLYALIGLCAGLIYYGIVERPRGTAATAARSLGPSRGIVYRLATLFSVDAFGGGFFVQAILALRLFKRFDLSVGAAATLFFWTNLLMAASYLGCPDCAADRTRQDDGLYAPTLEPLPDCDPFRLQPSSRGGSTPHSQSPLSDGCPDAKLLRDGGSHTARAVGCRRSHLCSPESCFRHQPDDRRISAQSLDLRLSATHRRSHEDCL